MAQGILTQRFGPLLRHTVPTAVGTRLLIAHDSSDLSLAVVLLPCRIDFLASLLQRVCTFGLIGAAHPFTVAPPQTVFLDLLEADQAVATTTELSNSTSESHKTVRARGLGSTARGRA